MSSRKPRWINVILFIYWVTKWQNTLNFKNQINGILTFAITGKANMMYFKFCLNKNSPLPNSRWVLTASSSPCSSVSVAISKPRVMLYCVDYHKELLNFSQVVMCWIRLGTSKLNNSKAWQVCCSWALVKYSISLLEQISWVSWNLETFKIEVLSGRPFLGVLCQSSAFGDLPTAIVFSNPIEKGHLKEIPH